MKYEIEKVEKISLRLKEIPESDGKNKLLNKQEVIKKLYKDIKSLQNKGYSLEQISNLLEKEGLEIKTKTLKSYLQRSKTQKKDSSKNTNN